MALPSKGVVMRRRVIVTLIVLVGLGATVACAPAPSQPGWYQSSWNPVTERHEAFLAACSVQDGWHVKVASWSEVFVRVTLPGDVIEEGMTVENVLNPWFFTSQAAVDAGQCYSVLLVDTLGTGPFTFNVILG